MKTTLILIVALQFCSVAMAQGDNEFTRKSLKGLTGVEVAVTPLDSDAIKDGLSEAQIQTDVELRLRMAGVKVLTSEEMLKAPGMPTLRVFVNTIKREELYSYSAEVYLEQNVRLARDPADLFIAQTWNCGAVGRVGSHNLNQIRDIIKDEVDKFINAYLSVNPKDPQNENP
jgi:hypothetical protein